MSQKLPVEVVEEGHRLRIAVIRIEANIDEIGWIGNQWIACWFDMADNPPR